jgi:hypothetical protein
MHGAGARPQPRHSQRGISSQLHAQPAQLQSSSVPTQQPPWAETWGSASGASQCLQESPATMAGMIKHQYDQGQSFKITWPRRQRWGRRLCLRKGAWAQSQGTALRAHWRAFHSLAYALCFALRRINLVTAAHPMVVWRGMQDTSCSEKFWLHLHGGHSF